MPEFNKDDFLQHIITSLRVGGIDMTPVGAPRNSIVYNEHKPNYHAVIYGHTPDYQGEKMPPYKVDIWIYPEQQKLYVQDGTYGQEHEDIMFASTGRMPPAVHYFKTQGFLGMHCEHWEVEVI